MMVRGVSSIAKIKEDLAINYTGEPLKISFECKIFNRIFTEF